MKSAGKLFPRDMGDYDPDVVYDLVDFVAHANSLWCCLQPGTCGIEPSKENKEHWHCIISARLTDASRLGDIPAEEWMKLINTNTAGMNSGTATFNADGSITETGRYGTKDTVFNDDGSISETWKDTEGKVVLTKNTTFDGDEIREEVKG